MTAKPPRTEDLLRQAIIKIAGLAGEDLPILIEFVDYLQQHRLAESAGEVDVDELRRVIRQRAIALDEVPRQEIVDRFKELVEEIRSQAADQGTAIEGDRRGD